MNAVRIGGLADARQPDQGLLQLLGDLRRGEDHARAAVGDGAAVEEPQRLGHIGVVGHRLGRVEDAFERDLLVQMGVEVQQRVVVVLHGHHRQVPLGHAVLLHVKAGEHRGQGGQGDAIDILGQRMAQRGDEVRRIEVVNLAQALGAGDQHDVVQAGGHGHEARLDGRGAGSGAVLDDLGAGRGEAQRIHDRAGQAALVVEPGAAHVGHIDVVHLG